MVAGFKVSSSRVQALGAQEWMVQAFEVLGRKFRV